MIRIGELERGLSDVIIIVKYPITPTYTLQQKCKMFQANLLHS